MKSVQYSSFGMAMVLLLRIRQFPIGWIILMLGYFPGTDGRLLFIEPIFAGTKSEASCNCYSQDDASP